MRRDETRPLDVSIAQADALRLIVLQQTERLQNHMARAEAVRTSLDSLLRPDPVPPKKQAARSRKAAAHGQA